MFIPTQLLQATSLIKEGALEIEIGSNLVRLEKDLIQLNISDTESLRMLLDREDILRQMMHTSEEFSRAGKTLEIKYRNSRIVRLGAKADSLMLQLLGIDHVTMGNPVTMYRFLRMWGKS
ncbi:MAG: hypothetical protein HXS44_17805 [Theionarchaea archaeon]|nr:hypothetical protein [Theionarchaea archaeon]